MVRVKVASAPSVTAAPAVTDTSGMSSSSLMVTVAVDASGSMVVLVGLNSSTVKTSAISWMSLSVMATLMVAVVSPAGMATREPGAGAVKSLPTQAGSIPSGTGCQSKPSPPLLAEYPTEMSLPLICDRVKVISAWPEATSSATDASATDTTGGSSSSFMVPVAEPAVALTVAPVALSRVTVKVSECSSMESSMVFTLIVAVVDPAVTVTVSDDAAS